MNTVIDTLRFSEKLQAEGFTTEQANTLARALADEMGEQLATKKDLERFELATKRDLERFELATKRGLERFELATKRGLERFELATKKEFERIEGEIKALHLRIDNLEIRFNFLFALLGLLIALELVPVVRALTG